MVRVRGQAYTHPHIYRHVCTAPSSAYILFCNLNYVTRKGHRPAFVSTHRLSYFSCGVGAVRYRMRDYHQSQALSVETARAGPEPPPLTSIHSSDTVMRVCVRDEWICVGYRFQGPQDYARTRPIKHVLEGRRSYPVQEAVCSDWLPLRAINIGI